MRGKAGIASWLLSRGKEKRRINIRMLPDLL